MSQSPDPIAVASPAAHIRIARPSGDLAAAETFYTGGLALEILHRSTASVNDESDLLMLGWPGAQWHLELTRHPRAPIWPTPTADDLLVLYFGEPISESMVERLQASGGRRVASRNPYWDRHGVTIEDPDGYRLVLCTREWSDAPPESM